MKKLQNEKAVVNDHVKLAFLLNHAWNQVWKVFIMYLKIYFKMHTQ